MALRMLRRFQCDGQMALQGYNTAGDATLMYYIIDEARLNATRSRKKLNLNFKHLKFLLIGSRYMTDLYWLNTSAPHMRRLSCNIPLLSYFNYYFFSYYLFIYYLFYWVIWYSALLISD